MRVSANLDLCESNGLCVAIAPDVFDFRTDDRVHVLDEEPPDALRAQVEEAAQVCPKRAIHLRN